MAIRSIYGLLTWAIKVHFLNNLFFAGVDVSLAVPVALYFHQFKKRKKQKNNARKHFYREHERASHIN